MEKVNVNKPEIKEEEKLEEVYLFIYSFCSTLVE